MNSVSGTIYDALGRKAWWTSGSSTIVALYGPIGYLGTSTNWRVPLPGGATAIPGINFEHKDWLGSAPVVSTRTQTIVADRLFSPYGETIYTYSGGSTDVVFTGDAQDFVQGLFDTPMRELNSAGRWTSPDPAGASWNAYAYTTNPLGETDPSGAWPVGPYYGNSITQDPNTAWDTGLPVCTRPGCKSGNDPIITIKVVVNAESLETAKRNAALQDQIKEGNKERWSRAQNKKDPSPPPPAKKASTGERVAMALSAIANVIVGAPKAVAGATGVATAGLLAPTVLGSLAIGIPSTYELVQGTGQLQSANLQATAAITGNTEGVDDKVDRLTVSTSISGSVATALNGGDYHTGAKWAAVEGLASGSLKREIFNGIGNIIDTLMSARDVVTP